MSQCNGAQHQDQIIKSLLFDQEDKYPAATTNFTPEVQGFQIDENVPMR